MVENDEELPPEEVIEDPIEELTEEPPTEEVETPIDPEEEPEDTEPEESEEEPPIVHAPPTDKLLVFDDGTYETGYWLSTESYPNSVCYIIDADSEVAAKIHSLYPYFTLNVEDGVLVDVTPREKTQEEIDKENAPPPKTPEQLRIEQLEAQLSESDARFEDIELILSDLLTGGF